MNNMHNMHNMHLRAFYGKNLYAIDLKYLTHLKSGLL